MADQQTTPATRSLLDLPDPALLAVLRCLAADRGLSSLFNAARAHSTLHQLSAAALDSISAELMDQQRVASVKLYLSRHCVHVQSLHVHHRHVYTEQPPWLAGLPPGLQLQSLSLSRFHLQLLPGGGHTGVLQPGAPIKHLEMIHCSVSDTPCEAVVQALTQLPQLESLAYANWGRTLAFPGHILSHLQQLTSLNVLDATGDVLEHVDLVPSLLDLKASVWGDNSSTKLSVLQQLTSLVISFRGYPGDDSIHPAGLANKSHLQHLDLDHVRVAGGPAPAGVCTLLCHLQQMTQLTHLSLQGSWGDLAPYSGPPAAAYTVLTASSTLQYLDVSSNTMPQGVLQHLLPANRQMPQLQVLRLSQCGELGHHWTHADTAWLASCWPNLQGLSLCTHAPAHVLRPLHSLAALTALEVSKLDDAGFAATAGFTQLQQLRLYAQKATDAGLLQLTQLRQLTELTYGTTLAMCQVFGPRDEEDEPVQSPVWQRLLDYCLKSRQPGVAELAQQAAASLEHVAP